MQNNQNNQNLQKKIVVPRWVTLLMFIIAVAFIFVILYLQFTRYKLVGQSLDLKDTLSTGMLLSPEISFGLVNIIGALA